MFKSIWYNKIFKIHQNLQSLSPKHHTQTCSGSSSCTPPPYKDTKLYRRDLKQIPSGLPPRDLKRSEGNLSDRACIDQQIFKRWTCLVSALYSSVQTGRGEKRRGEEVFCGSDRMCESDPLVFTGKNNFSSHSENICGKISYRDTRRIISQPLKNASVLNRPYNRPCGAGGHREYRGVFDM